MRPSSPDRASAGSAAGSCSCCPATRCRACARTTSSPAARFARSADVPLDWPYRSVRGTLARKISSPIGRLDYARVRIVDGRVEPLAVAGASVLSSTTRADGFVDRRRRQRRVRSRQRTSTSGSMREQEQFLQVLDRDEAERRFRAAVDLAPRGVERVAARRRPRPRAGGRRRLAGGRAVVRSVERRRLRASWPRTRSAPPKKCLAGARSPTR